MLGGVAAVGGLSGCISLEGAAELGAGTGTRGGGGAVGSEAAGEEEFPIGTEASGLGSELDTCVGSGGCGAFVVVEGAFRVFPVGNAIKDDTSVGCRLRGHQRCLLEAGMRRALNF